jgi:hypothetical protein
MIKLLGEPGRLTVEVFEAQMRDSSSAWLNDTVVEVWSIVEFSTREINKNVAGKDNRLFTS